MRDCLKARLFSRGRGFQNTQVLTVFFHQAFDAAFVEGFQHPRRHAQLNPAVLVSQKDLLGNEVYFEFPTGFPVGMRYRVPGSGAFAGDLTDSGHNGKTVPGPRSGGQVLKLPPGDRYSNVSYYGRNSRYR